MANAQKSPTERTPPITTECYQEKGDNGREELVTSTYTGIKRKQQQQYLEDIKEKTVQKLLPQVTGTPTASGGTGGTTPAATGKSAGTETEVMKRMFNLPSFKRIPKEIRERLMEEMRGETGSDDDASSGYQSLASSQKSL